MLNRLIRRSIFGLTAIVAVTACFASPGVVIVQTTATRASDADPNRSLLQFMAQEIDDEGRLSPIAWSMTDPIFRSAADSKLVANPDRQPTIEEATAFANRVKADYVLMITVWKRDKSLKARAWLYKKGKLVWQDPPIDEKLTAAEEQSRRTAEKLQKKQKPPTDEEREDKGARSIDIQIGGKTDVEDTLRSLAHTWNDLLGATALKSFTAKPRIATPTPDQGHTPTVIEPAPIRKIDNKALLTEVMKDMASGQKSQAIATLRDAVDSEPLDTERRRVLVSTLMVSGMPELAAGEARRAANLFPDQVDLRIMAARAWMAAGKVDEANLDLNEAVARDSQSVEVRALLGEISLINRQIPAALDHFDFIVGKSPSPDAYFKRALARAMNCDGAGCGTDLAEVAKTPNQDPLIVSAEYRFAIQVVDADTDSFAEDMRQLMKAARVKASDPQVATDLEKYKSKISALVVLFGQIAVPPQNKDSHNVRLLALKLLSQTLGQVATYTKSADLDVLDDATLNLGEGLRQMNAAKTAYNAELSKG